LAAREAYRRLRLAGLISGLTKLQAAVSAANASDDVDVIVRLSASDPASTARVREVLSDLRVRVVEGHWERA
jgi:hypothetical protein